MLTDECFGNSIWSFFTGIKLNEINVMEREFLRLVDMRLHVNNNDYYQWIFYIEFLSNSSEDDENKK